MARLDVPEASSHPSAERPAVSVERPAVSVERPAVSVERPAASVEGPAVSVERLGGSPDRGVPEATVARLATYLRVLTSLRGRSPRTVSSGELAAAAGVNSAKLRKDLSHLGSYGVRGVGYDVNTLTASLSTALGLSGQDHPVVLVGVGNLGQALAGYDGFASRGFRIAALLDVAPGRVGTTLRGLVVRHVEELQEVVEAGAISIAVIATPASAAQDVSDRLAEAGVTAILNFAPTEISVPESVDVRNVDLAAELQILSFHEHRKARDLGGAPRHLDERVAQ